MTKNDLIIKFINARIRYAKVSKSEIGEPKTADAIRYNSALAQYIADLEFIVNQLINELFSGSNDSRIAFCYDCKTTTIQKTTFTNPDEPSRGEAWQCDTCQNLVEFYNDVAV